MRLIPLLGAEGGPGGSAARFKAVLFSSKVTRLQCNAASFQRAADAGEPGCSSPTPSSPPCDDFLFGKAMDNDKSYKSVKTIEGAPFHKKSKKRFPACIATSFLPQRKLPPPLLLRRGCLIPRLSWVFVCVCVCALCVYE